ncbi:MAG: NUDIX domain-containing protein [Acetobacteraceae bacterium]
MGLRGAGHRFMPNRLVFPGGAVDTADARAPAAAEPRTATLAMLARNAPPRLARALVMAAARELQEETGLSFGAPPRLDTMAYLCRAVTPPHLPIRFNARFLAADAATVEGEPLSSHELEDVRFYPLEEALALDTMHVTHEVLLRLQAMLSMPEPERRADLFVFKRRRWELEKPIKLE